MEWDQHKVKYKSNLALIEVEILEEIETKSRKTETKNARAFRS